MHQEIVNKLSTRRTVMGSRYFLNQNKLKKNEYLKIGDTSTNHFRSRLNAFELQAFELHINLDMENPVFISSEVKTTYG